jgi:hypothetical protein
MDASTSLLEPTAEETVDAPLPLCRPSTLLMLSIAAVACTTVGVILAGTLLRAYA